jgi:lincosamide nucleotidyltransferase A/C/D/E
MGDEVTEAVAAALCDALDAAQVRFWVGGGWGVDALTGRQTRAHRDLDLLVHADDEAVTLDVLGRRGYVIETDWRPVRVELGRPGGGYVDIHPVTFDRHGNGIQAGLGDMVYRYAASVFTTGRIAAQEVGCISVSRQIEAHQGYPHRPQDRHDLALLVALLTTKAV